jgi:dsRNA-specific ribonuclease
MDKLIAHDEDIDENMWFNPFNTINKEISLSEVQTILARYGVTGHITNLALYQRAFVHRSYCTRPFLEEHPAIKTAQRPAGCMDLRSKSNERLEFLGDGVLECITKYYLYRRFPTENEGFMTEKKIALVKNEAIGKLALDMGLAPWYVVSRHAEEKNVRCNLKKLGCLFEAFIGALFLDFNKAAADEEWSNTFLTGPGFQTAQLFLERVFETHVDWTAVINNDDNFKNILQVKIQKEFKTTPEYVQMDHSDRGYHMGVYLCLGQPIWKANVKQALAFSEFGSFEAIHKYVKTHPATIIFLGNGMHKIKKKSEQLACEQALKASESGKILSAPMKNGSIFTNGPPLQNALQDASSKGKSSRFPQKTGTRQIYDCSV